MSQLQKNVCRPDPKIRVLKWVRGYEKLVFNEPRRFLIPGIPGAGKSALLETIAVHYPKIIDLFCSRDGEGLAWLRHDKYKNNALLITGDSVKLSCEWDVKKISQLKMVDISAHQTIISVPAFYSNPREEWSATARMTDILWRRSSWQEPWAVLIREAASLIYARLGVGDNQYMAKAILLYAIREFRHCGYAAILDSIRLKGVDIEAREIADYTMIKKHGIWGIPRDLKFLFHWYSFEDFRKMPKWVFVLATQEGNIATCDFQEPYWHKYERESMLDIFKIEPSYGDTMNYGDRRNNISDFEHSRIIMARLSEKETNNKLVSMQKLGLGGIWKYKDETITLLQRSPASIMHEIDQHNQDIAVMKSCQLCKRMDAPVHDQPA